MEVCHLFNCPKVVGTFLGQGAFGNCSSQAPHMFRWLYLASQHYDIPWPRLITRKQPECSPREFLGGWILSWAGIIQGWATILVEKPIVHQIPLVRLFIIIPLQKCLIPLLLQQSRIGIKVHVAIGDAQNVLQG